METFLFFHSASSETWETIADVGSWMVVWGVVGEGLEISIKLAALLRVRMVRFWDVLSLYSLLKWARGKCAICLDWCHRHELIVEVWAGFWWLVVVLGLVIELGANQRARTIDGAENARLHTRAANLEKDNLVLRSNVVALEIKLNPRIITAPQFTNFMFLTVNIPKIPITVRPSKRGDDTDGFAYQVRHLLDSAGFGPPTNSGDWGITRSATDPIFVRPIGNKTELPHIMLLCGSNGIAQFPEFHYEVTNGFPRPLVLADSVGQTSIGQTYNALLFCFRLIQIPTDSVTNVPWVKPGEFEFDILPKNN